MSKNNHTAHEIIISPKDKWYHIGVFESFRYKDLVLLLIRRNFVLQYKQTVLGPLWLVLGPLITSLTFSIVFGQFANIATDGAPHFLFYMTGFNMWTLFNTCVTNVGGTFTQNTALFGKVYFPRLTVPVAQTITSIINFFLQGLVLIGFYVGYAVTIPTLRPSPAMLLSLPLILHCALLGLGFGLILASLTTRYRDLNIAVGFGMQLWMFATPIVYPLSGTGGLMRTVLLINPVSAIVNNFRYVFLGSGTLLLLPWLYSLLMTLALLFIGLVLYSRTQRTFIDTI